MSAHPHPLALTQAQLTTVMNCAISVPHQWRPRYLQMVADLLIDSEINDATVERAAEHAAQHMTAQPAASKVA